MADRKDWSNKQRLLPISSILRPGAQTAIRDVSADYWFGPLQPVAPVAPASYRPRQFGFDPGANIIWQPKGDSPISFEVLRALADSWDLLRLVIETRKDQLCELKGEVRARQQPGEKVAAHKQRNQEDPTVQELNHFLAKPDGFHPFHKWLRLWLEDMLVIDAVTLYLERDAKGRIARIIPLAGDTINRLLTDQGITPPAPSPAYQQVVYGLPVMDMSTDDLIYSMRNERTWKRYGYSRVEQILITISIGLRRQDFQLKYYTDSNVPEAMCFVPGDWPIDKVKEVQTWFDSILAGDLAQRRRLLFMPGFGTGNEAKPNVIFTKEKLLQDVMDEWLARLVCFNFGISPQALQKQMHSYASARQSSDTAKEEGLEPDKREVESVMNLILDALGYSGDYEWVFQDARETDVLKQAQADKIYLAGGVNTINEIREAKGDDPRDEENASRLGILTATGWVPIDPEPGEPGGPPTPEQQQQEQEKHEAGLDAIRMRAQNPVGAGAPPPSPNGKPGAGKPGKPGGAPGRAGATAGPRVAEAGRKGPGGTADSQDGATGRGGRPAGRTKKYAGGGCERHRGYPRTFCRSCQGVALDALAELEAAITGTGGNGAGNGNGRGPHS